MRTVGRALFLDLDGTLIVTKSGKTFAENKDDWKFNRNILERVEKYVDMGWFIMIVSNQGGIELGHVLLNDFRHKMRQVTNQIISATGCPFARIGNRFSMSNNPEDFYRKPNPGMGYELALSYILNLNESIMVGDASGKVRKKETVYGDSESPTKWSWRDGKNLTAEQAKRVIPGGLMGTLETRDFSDSDLLFAEACGMEYIDIENFLDKVVDAKA